MSSCAPSSTGYSDGTMRRTGKERQPADMIKRGLMMPPVILFLLTLLMIECAGYYVARRKRTAGLGNPGAEVTGERTSGGIERSHRLLKRKLEGLSPRGIFIVIDTAHNLLYLKKGGTLLRKAIISSGSGNVLKEPGGQRKWVFDTPRGEYVVRSKLRNPFWIKPDWAFVEEGKCIPPKDAKERVDPYALGEYAIGFGNGYFIHGTLYTRLLGRNVTHGCIRVGDEDLLAIYKAVPVGAKVYIF